MKKILIHTVTNPCVDKSNLELFLLKCYRFIKNNLGNYEFHLYIDSWEALVDNSTSLLSYSIDHTKYKSSDDYYILSKEIDRSYLNSQNNIKEIINEIVKENKIFTKSFKTIKTSVNNYDYLKYNSNNHFNIIGNTFKNIHSEYDFYIFKSINSIVTNTSSLTQAINELNNTNIPLVFTNKFFKNKSNWKNNSLSVAVDTLSLFVIKNNVFFDYLKKIDNNPNIRIINSNGDILKLSKTFLFGISDMFPDKIQNKTIPRLEYINNFSDFNSGDTIPFDVFSNYLKNNTFIRKQVEAGPFLFELILFMFYSKNINKNFDTTEELKKYLPSEYEIDIVRFDQHKQNFIFLIEHAINTFSKNNNIDISKLQYLLEEIDIINSNLKKLLNLPTDIDISNDLVILKNQMSNNFIPSVKKYLEEILDKYYA